MEKYLRLEHLATQKFISLANQMCDIYYDMITILDSVDGSLISNLMNQECPDDGLNDEMFDAYNMTFAPISFDELSLRNWVDCIETIYNEYYRRDLAKGNIRPLNGDNFTPLDMEKAIKYGLGMCKNCSKIFNKYVKNCNTRYEWYDLYKYDKRGTCGVCGKSNTPVEYYKPHTSDDD